MLQFSVCACVLPIFLTICATFLQIDQLNYVLGDILPDPCYREISTIIISLVMRSTSLFFACCEACRTVYFLGLYVIVLFTKLLNSLQGIFAREICVSLVPSRFRRLLIIHGMFQRSISKLSGLALSSLFWGQVLLFWLMIKGVDNIPTSIFLIVILGSVFIALFLVFIMYIVSESSVVVKEGLNNSFKRVGHYRKFRYKYKVLRQEIRSLRACEISYGTFMKMDRNMFSLFFNQLLDKSLNSLLIF